MNSERKISQKSAKELKDEAIKKALLEAAKNSSISISTTETKQKSKKVKKTTFKFSFGRFSLAFICAAASVFSITYLISTNVPDIAANIAAIQTSIEAVYPSYTPRNFQRTNVISENGKVTISFANPETNTEYYLIEEQSSWDSATLLNNYVKAEYGNDYTIVRESGLTIYINNSNATWVTGGIVFTLKTTSGSLTKKQITSIAVSL